METITMSVTEQRRALVLTRVVAGELAPAAGALALGCSERQVWRLLARFRATGPAGLAHGNRGRGPLDPSRHPPMEENDPCPAREGQGGPDRFTEQMN